MEKILDVRQDSAKELELKNMVESLQNALFLHKQHIANEVKDVVTQELTQIFTNSYKNMLENANNQLSNLEYKVRFQFQSIDNRLEIIETKCHEITEKIKSIEENFSAKNFKIEEELKKINEKCILFENSLKNLSESLKRFDETQEKTTLDISSLKENYNSTKLSIVSEVVQHLNDYRREIEVIRYESASKLQSEVHNLCEKINEIRYGFDNRLQRCERFPESHSKVDLKLRENELFEYVQAGLSKTTIEVSQLRLRVEKLEITEQAFEDFRKSRLDR